MTKTAATGPKSDPAAPSVTETRPLGEPAKPKAGRSKLSKKAHLVRLLRGKAGADLTTLSRKLGWQPHTTRAAISRLRKEGYSISAAPPAAGKPLRYKILTTPPKEASDAV